VIKYSSRVLVLGLTAALLAIPSSQAFAQATPAAGAGSVTGTDPEPPPPPPPSPSSSSSIMDYVVLIMQAGA
jgi:hypothetical protein